MQSKYSIKNLEQLSGIKAHTLRAWESRYKILIPHRTSTNIRYYDDHHLKKVLNISILLKSGMKIGKLARMADEELAAAVKGVGKHQGLVESGITNLKLAMLNYDEAMFNDIFTTCLVRNGLEDTMDKVMGTFIHEVGMLWQTGAISVSHEHFISNLIKMKLFSLIENLTPEYGPGAKTAVLFLPSGEMHELSLLYLYYHLKNKGCRVFYLGQSLPLEYVKHLSSRTKIDFYVSVCTTQPHFEEVGFYFERIAQHFDLATERFFLTGAQCCDEKVVSKFPGIEVVSDVGALKLKLLEEI